MIQKNTLLQQGRSMIEMLGVLAIVGVLSVGGLEVINKSREASKTANLLSGVSHLAATIVQQSKYYDDVESASYEGSYPRFLNQIGKIPAEFTYFSDSTGDYRTGALKSELGAIVTATAALTNGYVGIEIENLSKSACVKLASNNWGTKRTSRFFALNVGNGKQCPASSRAVYSDKAGYPMPVAKATEYCNGDKNIVDLIYKLR
jgi:type II secretory pathway pseudopilin PulG